MGISDLDWRDSVQGRGGRETGRSQDRGQGECDRVHAWTCIPLSLPLPPNVAVDRTRPRNRGGWWRATEDTGMVVPIARGQTWGMIGRLRDASGESKEEGSWRQQDGRIQGVLWTTIPHTRGSPCPDNFLLPYPTRLGTHILSFTSKLLLHPALLPSRQKARLAACLLALCSTTHALAFRPFPAFPSATTCPSDLLAFLCAFAQLPL